MDEELFLPVLSHFENGNFWTASGGALRYKVVPDTGESPRLTAEVWEGPWRYQDSTVEETKEFPLSEEGLEELRHLAYEDLDAALLLGCELTIQDMEERGMPVHQNTLQARDYLKGRQE